MQELPREQSWPEEVLTEYLENVRVSLVAAQMYERAAPWFCRIAEGMPTFYVITDGGCRFRLNGSDEDLAAGAGDLVVLLRGQSHCLQHIPQKVSSGSEVFCPKTKFVRARFTFEDKGLATLRPELPEIIHLSGKDFLLNSWMERMVQTMMCESASSRAVTRALVDHMAWMIFALSVRIHQ